MNFTHFKGLAAGLTLIVTAAVPAVAETVLKVSTPLPIAHTFQKTMEAWAQEVKERSGGDLILEIYPAGQLGPMNRQFEVVQSGVADVALIISSQTPGRFPMTDLSAQPFTSPSGEKTMEAAAKRLTTLAPQYLAGEYPGTKILWMATTPPLKLLYKKDKPIKSLADFSGLRVRYAGETPQKVLTILGASPMAVPAPEVADSMSKGIVDGALFPFEAAKAFDIAPVTKYALELGFSTNSFTVLMNQNAYHSLTDSQRKVINETTGVDAAMAYGRLLDEGEVESRKYLIEKGVQMGVLSEDQLAAVLGALNGIAQQEIERLEGMGLPAQEFYSAYTK
ncbi:TRAP-type C4-dicarboxylate transport system substrate-binding protein [Rhizobium sp. SJZ105]|uniref:TRAP transporter substrate-binding protein n=1 Tax=Rhizobium sp. SJZ105 TaxID=2572678 RepID=UPI0011A57F8A|nr:TRAP transporter substrate-binding protein [Rhizobium sp. SJZ105]TWC76371.1 TRAP-type C4-dicarboxylate transport system substrate-binding protein [Rhizobium sp. SJZ105]